MHQRLPHFAIVLGLFGLLPFIGCALASLSLTEPQSAFATQALIAYGAVILAFLGGVHWGLVLDAEIPTRAGLRLTLGVVPSLIGWVALLLPLLLPVEAALGLLVLGFAATMLTESRLRRQELMPHAYLRLRWVLSVVVILVLLGTLILRPLGAKIIF